MAAQDGDGLGWNRRRGGAWADLQPMLDSLFEPVEEILVETSLASGATRVLDVGCGAGATTLAVAKRLAPQGHCTGIDISTPLLEAAQSRASAAGIGNAGFLQGDAQRFDFMPDTFDAVTSRFGIMFFDDPVQAFTNIGHAVCPNGTLTCMVWRSKADNPFMTAAERAVAPLLGWTEERDAPAPGQFAFADADRVDRILQAAGWTNVEIAPVNVPCRLTKDDLHIYARRMGRVGVVLPDLDRELHERVERALDEAFAPYVTEETAQFEAACWLIKARAQ